MVKKDGSFCDQNLQFAVILHKELKIFIFIFFNFDSSFFQDIFRCNILLGRGFPAIPGFLNSSACGEWPSGESGLVG